MKCEAAAGSSASRPGLQMFLTPPFPPARYLRRMGPLLGVVNSLCVLGGAGGKRCSYKRHACWKLSPVQTGPDSSHM